MLIHSKNILTCLLVSASVCCAHGMETTTVLLKELADSVLEVEKQFKQANGDPRKMDEKSRVIAMQKLVCMQEASKKLCAMLQDRDGWITEVSEK